MQRASILARPLNQTWRTQACFFVRAKHCNASLFPTSTLTNYCLRRKENIIVLSTKHPEFSTKNVDVFPTARSAYQLRATFKVADLAMYTAHCLLDTTTEVRIICSFLMFTSWYSRLKRDKRSTFYPAPWQQLSQNDCVLRNHGLRNLSVRILFYIALQ